MENRLTSRTITIQPFTQTNGGDVVRIHQDVLGYTVNSLLGRAHLASIYSVMAQEKRCYVGVAQVATCPVGVVSGALNLNETTQLMWHSLTPIRAARILLGLAKKPALIAEIRKSQVIARPVRIGAETVEAILTTIAIAKPDQGKGIGKILVQSLEAYFVQNGVHTYRLDTLIENHGARRFYQAAGFVEVETRLDSIILIKRISP
jgi:GNAT superfamily N-acetyltransferase